MNDGDQSSNNGDQTLILPVSISGERHEPVNGDRHEPAIGDRRELPDHLWIFDEFSPVGERAATEVVTGLTSLPYISAALKRLAWLWIATGLIGVLGGAVAFIAFPPAYEATTSLLLTNNPTQDPVEAMTTDVTLAQSRSVADLAVSKLTPAEPVASFMKACGVASETDRVMAFTCSGPTTDEALKRTAALASGFLQFRATQLQGQQQSLVNALNQQVAVGQQRVTVLDQQIKQLSSLSASSDQSAKLTGLQNQRTRAEANLSTLEQTVTGTQANNQVTLQTMLKNSGVLDPAAIIAHSRLKLLVVYVLAGLFGGLAIGVGIVIVRVLVSDRLRRRDDVAHALGAPVKLSVGAVRTSRWRPGQRGLAAAGNRQVQRIAAHLSSLAPASSGSVALAVAAIDNADAVALPLLSLAQARAQEGGHVVVADLSERATAARLLGVKGPGVHQLGSRGDDLVLVVPETSSTAPIGPFGRGMSLSLPTADASLTRACESADLILTLFTPDPSFGADHLRTWAEHVVVVITAGRSSSTRIQAAGEILRIAGMQMSSAVLIGADKTDESLGTLTVAEAADAGPDAGMLGK